MRRTNSPAAVDIDFGAVLAENGIPGRFDEHTVEVVTYAAEAAKAGDRPAETTEATEGGSPILAARRSGQSPAREPGRRLLPWRVQRYYPGEKVTLSFVVPNETCTAFAVYFDTVESGRGKPRRYPGLVGDGDSFRVGYGRRAIAACHFDAFGDLDGDGDLDLFCGGVEPFDRDYGTLLKNVGTPTAPRWEAVAADHGALHTETHQICDALRQNVVRAVDFNQDGRTDLLAGDCDGFIWYFRNRTDHRSALFAPGERLTVGGKPLSLAANLGHARPDICDWNNDGRKDLVASDGAGTVTVYLNEGTDAAPVLGQGQRVLAYDTGGKLTPVDRGTRSHLAVCDYNCDGKKDLLFADQQNPGFYFFENVATDAEPRFSSARNIGLTPYVRPNFGSLVDWDGDGRKDLIACEFEHSIRFYRNVGSGQPGATPKFADPDGVVIVRPYSIMMISGADVVDWNRDGDLDVLTGQGHGGNGIRFYERDYIEDGQRGTRPKVTVERLERAGPREIEAAAPVAGRSSQQP